MFKIQVGCIPVHSFVPSILAGTGTLLPDTLHVQNRSGQDSFLKRLQFLSFYNYLRIYASLLM